jgi:hypothetical protein
LAAQVFPALHLTMMRAFVLAEVQSLPKTLGDRGRPMVGAGPENVAEKIEEHECTPAWDFFDGDVQPNQAARLSRY